MCVEHRLQCRHGIALAAVDYRMFEASLVLALEQFVDGLSKIGGIGGKLPIRDASALVDEEGRVRLTAVLAVNLSAEIVDEDRHLEFFFVAKDLGGVDLVRHVLVRAELFSGVCLADIRRIGTRHRPRGSPRRDPAGR